MRLVMTALLLAGVGCGTTSRDALIAASEHRLEDARVRSRTAHEPGDHADDAAFELYAAQEHLAAARDARDGRGSGGTGEARDAFTRAEQAVVLPR